MTAHRDTGFFTESLSTRDPELFGSITNELGRQRHEIELIASENIVSRAVMEAQGSVMTNKYAEGYPGKRYYGGCEFVDIAEQLAIDRAAKGAEGDPRRRFAEDACVLGEEPHVRAHLVLRDGMDRATGPVGGGDGLVAVGRVPDR